MSFDLPGDGWGAFSERAGDLLEAQSLGEVFGDADTVIECQVLVFSGIIILLSLHLSASPLMDFSD